MKRKLNIVKLVLTLLIVYNTGNGFSQAWGGAEKNKFGDLWSVDLSTGLTSYFGDLSLYDAEPFNKLSHESGLGLGLQITKYIGRSFGLSGQLLFGKIKGHKDELSFKTKLFEYSLQGRVDFVNLLSREKNHSFHLNGFVGIGHFLFDARMWEYEGEGGDESKEASKVPELVVYAGGGLDYQVAKNLAVMAELALRRSQNDKLDNYSKGNDYDYYTYLSVGIKYYISTFIKKPPKNKATVVYNQSRLKPLSRR
jgi:opacity protein-like surface antigen